MNDRAQDQNGLRGRLRAWFSGPSPDPSRVRIRETHHHRGRWIALGIDLNYEEIDDLMKLVDTDGSGHISYDEFISKMDVHLKKKVPVAGQEAQELLFHKLRALLENQDKTLYEHMSDFDFDDSGSILP